MDHSSWHHIMLNFKGTGRANNDQFLSELGNSKAILKTSMQHMSLIKMQGLRIHPERFHIGVSKLIIQQQSKVTT